MGVGMPQSLLLEDFGMHLQAVWGHNVYHVGSSVSNKVWRDVDVRALIADNVWTEMGFGHPDYTHSNPKWVALCLAFSALGKAMTGLPIDFQLQQTSWANEKYPTGRSWLGKNSPVPEKLEADND